ncbi:MAG TPA: hypothetical protein VHH54_03110, partial [Actinomycetota bacterium]|nr:hypothetical protein [Actinomycetota bacterium]
DVGSEHDMYRISRLDSVAGWARAEMTNAEPGSRFAGTRKTLFVSETSPVLSVCYRLPPNADDLSIESCLSPDYYGLLRKGRGGLIPYNGSRWRGFRLDEAAVWIALAPGERTGWAAPSKPEVGHGMNVRLHSKDRHFHLLIGCGPADDGALRSFGLPEETQPGED